MHGETVKFVSSLFCHSVLLKWEEHEFVSEHGAEENVLTL
jgi:hypothetical protein